MKALSARALWILVHSIAIQSAKQQREMPKFKILRKRGANDSDSFHFFLNLNAFPTNSVPRYFAYIVQVERMGIIAKKFK